jgi:lipopolysaccharide transport system permease protein
VTESAETFARDAERQPLAPDEAAGAPPPRGGAADVPVVVIRPPRWLEVDVGDVWRYRELVYFLVWRDLKVRYKQTVIGAAWAILQPVFTMILFVIIFGHLARLPSSGAEPPFYYAAVVLWTYFAQAVTQSANSIVEHQQVITKIYFPRLLLPVSAVVSALVDFGIASLVLVGLMVVYRTPIGWQVVLAPLFVLLAVVAAAGAGMLLAALNARFRDVRYALPFLVQIWMFASPVAYGVGLVPPEWRSLYALNPMAGAIEGFRWAALGGTSPSHLIWISAATGLGLALVGLFYFQKTEIILADVV